MPVPVWDEIQIKVTTADLLLVQQAKVRRNSFITFTTNFNYVLCGMIITRLAPIKCMCNRLRLGRARIERLVSDRQPGLHILFTTAPGKT